MVTARRIIFALILSLGLLLPGAALTATAASAGTIYGPQCSELRDGAVIWIKGIRYTCTHTRFGWWYVAYFGGCSAVTGVAPARVC